MRHDRRFNITTAILPVKFVWFRIAKTGTRTIFFLLRNGGVGFGIENGYQRRVSPKKYGDYFHFSFVRNPYTRLISGWQDKVLNGGAGFNPKNVDAGKLSDFNYFVDWVTSGDPMDLNIHFRPQVLLLPSTLHFLGRTERMESDVRQLLPLIGLSPDVEIPKRNASGAAKILPRDISERSKRKIEEFYAVDFSVLGYERA